MSMRPLNNSVIPGFAAKQAQLGSEEYSERVAKPVMQAVDSLPAAYRALVNVFGYIETYTAYRKGMTPEQISQMVYGGTPEEARKALYGP